MRFSWDDVVLELSWPTMWPKPVKTVD